MVASSKGIKIAFEPHHDRLAFGVAEAGIELQNLWAVFGDHQPDVDHAAVMDILAL